eukprot:3790121-Alexandrium_andersonii.AAC.1
MGPGGHDGTRPDTSQPPCSGTHGRALAPARTQRRGEHWGDARKRANKNASRDEGTVETRRTRVAAAKNK